MKDIWFSFCILHSSLCIGFTVVDLAALKAAQAEDAGEDDVFGLTQIERLAAASGLAIGGSDGQRQSASQIVSGQRSQAAGDNRFGGVIDPTHALDRRPTFAGALGVNRVPTDMIESHRIGGEE